LAFIRVGALNLRNILKLYNNELGRFPDRINIGNVQGGVLYYQLPACPQLRMLCHFFSDSDSFLSALAKCEKVVYWPKNMDRVIGLFLIIISFNQNEYITSRSRNQYMMNFDSVDFLLTPEYSDRTQIFAAKTEGWSPSDQRTSTFSCTPQLFWRAMREAVLRLRDIRYIN
jgi:hypothetical protein